MGNPLVSVIIPTYNRAYCLMRAVKSVLNQTYENLELIIVDDNSTDNTKEIVSKINDERVRYIKLSENQGAAHARNVGIKKAQGSFIAFLDSDDEYLPGKLKESLEFLNRCGEEIRIVCSNYWNADKNNNRTIGQKGKVDAIWHIPAPSTWLVRRKVFDEIGLFDKNLIPAEDRDFLFRFNKKFKLEFINKPLVIRHKLKDSVSSNAYEHIKMRRIFLEKHRVSLQKNKKFLAYQLYRLGKDLFNTGNKIEGRRYILKSFLTYPIRIDYLGKFLKSFVF